VQVLRAVVFGTLIECYFDPLLGVAVGASGAPVEHSTDIGVMIIS